MRKGSTRHCWMGERWVEVENNNTVLERVLIIVQVIYKIAIYCGKVLIVLIRKEGGESREVYIEGEVFRTIFNVEPERITWTVFHSISLPTGLISNSIVREMINQWSKVSALLFPGKSLLYGVSRTVDQSINSLLS